MTVIKTYYDDDPNGIRLTTPDEVRALLARVQADSREHDAPLFTQWYVDGDADTPEFGVGIDGDKGVLSYSGRQWPGITVSHNPALADTGEVIAYDYMGNEREFPATAEIPFEQVATAAEEFFTRRGDRPDSVSWRRFV